MLLNFAIETLLYPNLQIAKMMISIARYRFLIGMQKKIKSMQLLQVFYQNPEFRCDFCFAKITTKFWIF